ncbi:MAG: hypothetical protein IAF38_05020 [Bacteroidia bacterium]|nr:hypothetical protein [Bacteroidia bacterium]
MLLCLSGQLTAQKNAYERAAALYNVNPQQALLAIDSALLEKKMRADGNCWNLRAGIYYEIFRKTERSMLFSPLRDSVVASVLSSRKNNCDSACEVRNKKFLKTIWAGYYNVAKTLLQDSINYSRSLIAYNKFKEIYLHYDRDATFEAKDVEYFLAVSAVYIELFKKENNNADAEIAKTALEKVLSIQPDNPAANINMGLIYCTRAENQKKITANENNAFKKTESSKKMISLAKEAEQFFLKVYNKDNSNLRAIENLYHVYLLLEDAPKAAAFKKAGEEKGIKFKEK